MLAATGQPSGLLQSFQTPVLCPVQVAFLAEHTGCDAARMHAPTALHGSEVELLAELDEELRGSCDASLRFDFACGTLLVRLLPDIPGCMPPTPAATEGPSHGRFRHP